MTDHVRIFLWNSVSGDTDLQWLASFSPRLVADGGSMSARHLCRVVLCVISWINAGQLPGSRPAEESNGFPFVHLSAQTLSVAAATLVGFELASLW